MTTIELTTTGIANGGEAVGRDADGRAVFVAGALPGERVSAEVVDERKRFARARLVAVLDAAPQRTEPPCPMVEAGCGGCDLQHASVALQHDLKHRIVVDALERIGGLGAPPVSRAAGLPDRAYRSTIRCVVEDGAPGFRRRHSHETVSVDECLVAHPLVDGLLRESDFGEADEVTLRAGIRTGERMIVAAPTSAGVVAPADTLVVGRDELKAGRRAWIHEVVAGHRSRISAESFFQVSLDGTEALVREVSQAVDRAPDGPLVDLYGGVGLFAATVGQGRQLHLVERSRSAVADARVNLAGLDARVIRCRTEDWRPSPAAVVVADPARSGLGAAGVAKVVETAASLVVLVSCDAASLGRDAALLTAAGYTLTDARLVDLFPQTSQVEVVSTFRKV